MRHIYKITVLCFVLTSCVNSHNNNTLTSVEIESTEDRVATLKREIVSKSEFHDAEFLLFNVNGFANSRVTGIPGPSSWNYRFGIKVKPSEIKNWIADFTRIDAKEYTFDWTNDLVVHRNQNWERKSVPEVYKREDGNTFIVVYQKEGIVFKQILGE
ncbi:hypothetical protein [Aquimarina algiphila]|uniref:Uncharacterized protein n=1 Tax=Aquimarina algiphila TaxID=2047982 RepID=A0A554VMC6_9FLAO|nr:hypothetical protein [Aquimarina algiphila]TSE09367.1 hypothetical protein FOF46_08925 [Aquimarina algiphila]